jgi:hypothetical protein
VISAPPPCEPITWSIDTTGVSHPGRTAVAARRAFDEWTAATGIRFVWQPSGGTVSIIFGIVPKEWIAYAAADHIVLGPKLADAWGQYQREVIAHEIGHVLGVGHEGAGLMGGNATHVTAADAALVTVCK